MQFTLTDAAVGIILADLQRMEPSSRGFSLLNLFRSVTPAGGVLSIEREIISFNMVSVIENVLIELIDTDAHTTHVQVHALQNGVMASGDPGMVCLCVWSSFHTLISRSMQQVVRAYIKGVDRECIVEIRQADTLHNLPSAMVSRYLTIVLPVWKTILQQMRGNITCMQFPGNEIYIRMQLPLG